MSKIGKQLIIIPENVEIKINQQEIKVKGPQGELSQSIPPQIKLILKDLPAKGSAKGKE